MCGERRAPLDLFQNRVLLDGIERLAGLVSMPWWRFTLAGALGEAVWVGLHVGIGFFFSGSILALAALLGDLGWMLAAATIAGLLAWRLAVVLRTLRRHRLGGAGGVPG